MSCRLERARAPAIPWNLPLGRPVSLLQVEQHGRYPALRSVHAPLAMAVLASDLSGDEGNNKQNADAENRHRD